MKLRIGRYWLLLGVVIAFPLLLFLNDITDEAVIRAGGRILMRDYAAVQQEWETLAIQLQDGEVSKAEYDIKRLPLMRDFRLMQEMLDARDDVAVEGPNRLADFYRDVFDWGMWPHEEDWATETYTTD